MTSYIEDNFKIFSDYLSIDAIHSSLCDDCYIVPVMKSEIDKIKFYL